MELNRCSCGKFPKYSERRYCAGHGEFPMVGIVECSCGRFCKEMIVDGFYGTTTTKADVIADWNEKHPKCDLCSTCDIGYGEDPENYSYSRCVSSCQEARVNMFLSASPKTGVIVDVLHFFPGRDCANTVGIYKPKFCPECGRDLRQINGFVMSENDTWCGATYDERADLYENQANSEDDVC